MNCSAYGHKPPVLAGIGWHAGVGRGAAREQVTMLSRIAAPSRLSE
ncbi:MAG: hypothetical protein ABIY40_02145 [Rhodanobacteraceae bacterium]